MTGYLALCRAAWEARENSYSPYSGFRVGAALLTKSGKLIVGTNVENASYPVGCCAERSAICCAVSMGEREFSAIAICGDTPFCTPCGMCRQALREFCGQMLPVLCVGKTPDTFKFLTLGELLPDSFSL